MGTTSMAALFEAMSSTPGPAAAGRAFASSPTPGPLWHRPCAQLPRLSFAPPIMMAETPEPATTLAAPGRGGSTGMSAVDITTISMSPAAHSAEVRTALATSTSMARAAAAAALENTGCSPLTRAAQGGQEGLRGSSY
jgi:hypothetical protein